MMLLRQQFCFELLETVIKNSIIVSVFKMRMFEEYFISCIGSRIGKCGNVLRELKKLIEQLFS